MTRNDGHWINATVDSHWLLYRKRLKACRKQHSEEAVHKLRIATRRLLALIELLQQLAPQSTLRKLRKTLKGQLDGFDALRDTQVMRLEIEALVGEHPQLTDFLHHLHVEEQALLMQTPAFIASLSRPKLARKLKKAGQHCRRQVSQDNLADDVIKVIDSLCLNVQQRFQAADPAQPATLHRLRIALKKLRYSLMLAEPLLPPLPQDHLSRMQRHLTRLGDIQNAVVLTDSLVRFFGTEPPDAIRRYVAARQQALTDDYLAHQQEIAAFWRANAEQAFPWLN